MNYSILGKLLTLYGLLLLFWSKEKRLQEFLSFYLSLDDHGKKETGSMELDNKQKVLIAIYTEYQKDLPIMGDAISASNLGISPDILKVILRKLTNEGYITGVVFREDDANPVPLATAMDNCLMTSRGIECVEDKLDIKPGLTGAEKVTSVVERSASRGWNQIRDIAVKVLAEMAK